MGLPLNQVVPNCAPNHMRLTTTASSACLLNKYHPHHHQYFSQQNHHSSHHHNHLHSRRPRRAPLVTAPGRPLVHARNTSSYDLPAPVVRGTYPVQSNSIQRKQQLMNKFKLNMAKSRLKLKELQTPYRNNESCEGGYKSRGSLNGYQKSQGNHRISYSSTNTRDVNIQTNINRIQYFKNSTPIVSNMPLINIQNSSILLINDSPFGLMDKRFGILHHLQPSETYYSWDLKYFKGKDYSQYLLRTSSWVCNNIRKYCGMFHWQ